jgi:hypothetical protein
MAEQLQLQEITERRFGLVCVVCGYLESGLLAVVENGLHDAFSGA